VHVVPVIYINLKMFGPIIPSTLLVSGHEHCWGHGDIEESRWRCWAANSACLPCTKTKASSMSMRCSWPYVCTQVVYVSPHWCMLRTTKSKRSHDTNQWKTVGHVLCSLRKVVHHIATNFLHALAPILVTTIAVIFGDPAKFLLTLGQIWRRWCNRCLGYFIYQKRQAIFRNLSNMVYCVAKVFMLQV